MSAVENKAVFLSYASQDADAATRICEALRAAGVEVWFDRSELRGGDTWDQKIRRQIKDCRLFLPVVSASTQARREGYFRLEWKLADDRTHLMAKGTPFLVPVCIDDTKDWDALVPDSFMSVQWTRLPGGETPDEFCERVGQLLSGDTTPPMATRERAPVAPAPAPSAPTAKKWPLALLALGACVAVGLGLYFGLRPAASPPPGVAAKSAPANAAWPRDPDLRRAAQLVSSTEGNSEDFALAEEIANKALAKNSTDPEAVTVMARVQVSYLIRGFDRSDERRAAARRYAERAVQLAPAEPEALAELGVFHISSQGRNLELARELLNKAIQLRPDEPYYYRHRDNALFVDSRVPPAEAIASAEKTAERFPRDALAQYELARHYRDLGRIDECERAIDRALAIEPLANAIGWKARIALNIRGDLAEMKSLLDRVPPRMRSLERVVIGRWIYAMAGTDREDGVNALQGLTNSWIEDFYYVGPKSLLMAALLEASGKPDSARLYYEAALTELRDRRARSLGDLSLRSIETCALLGLGRSDEARAANRVVLESVRHPYHYDPFETWWFSEIPCCLLLGERETALQLLREAASGEAATLSNRTASINIRAALRMAMKQDTRMLPFRDDPEIVALLAEPKKETVSAPSSEAAQLAARALALFTKVGFTRDDLGPAEDLARRATEKEPDNPAAWGVRAGVQSAWIFRNWDFSEKRLQETQTLANRALALDPDEPEALLALGHVLTCQRALGQAEALLRRASAGHPGHVRLARARGFALINGDRMDEARAVLLEAARRAPRDPLLRYELAMSYADYGFTNSTPNPTAALEQLDAAIALQPFSSALLLKATVLAGWRGDFAGMRAVLDQHERLPLVDRSEDRAVYVAMWAGLMERRLDRVEAAMALTARNYFDDSAVALRPKAWSLALAHQAAAKTNSARADWQAAESVLRQRLRDDPSNQRYQIELATTLAWLDQREEAARLVGLVEPVWKENPSPNQERMLARYYAARGDGKQAAVHLAGAVDSSAFTSRHVLPLDPWWDKIRGDPEFKALIAEKKPDAVGGAK